jgi:hypothetical protein
MLSKREEKSTKNKCTGLNDLIRLLAKKSIGEVGLLFKGALSDKNYMVLEVCRTSEYIEETADASHKS